MPWNKLADGTLNIVSDKLIAEGFFGGKDVIPQFFMTGDGHEKPSFKWIEKCPAMKEYFEQAMNAGKLCAHVERLPVDVAATDVPLFLQTLHGQNRIFGWELPIFGPLAKAGNLYYSLSPALANNQINRAVLKDFSEFSSHALEANALVASVGNPVGLTNVTALLGELGEYIVDVMAAPRLADANRSIGYRTRLKTYYDTIMELRTSAHAFIAAPIQPTFPICQGCPGILGGR